MNDPYLQQLLSDLKSAEGLLRHAIENRDNPFADNGDRRLKDCQVNVDRLHELIRGYKPVATPTSSPDKEQRETA